MPPRPKTVTALKPKPVVEFDTSRNDRRKLKSSEARKVEVKEDKPQKIVEKAAENPLELLE